MTSFVRSLMLCAPCITVTSAAVLLAVEPRVAANSRRRSTPSRPERGQLNVPSENDAAFVRKALRAADVDRFYERLFAELR